MKNEASFRNLLWNPSSFIPSVSKIKGLNDAKKGVARLLNCDYKELIFTGSGTYKAINLKD